ncbi:MAG: ATP synthase F0 subunit C [Puniceicoccales bacterium]|jgi:F-type H+-transporting ATPase subunit c|nr:ATP synthase F0 subunit C [Puniceicoccales bacterium]
MSVIAEIVGNIKDVAVGIVHAVGCAVAAIGVTCVGTRAVDAVGRNPGASGKILVQSILGMALAEAIAFYALFFSK